MKVRLIFIVCLVGLACAVFGQVSENRIYDLKITLNPNQKQMLVDGTVQIPASDKARETIDMLLLEQATEVKVEIISPPECAGPITLTKLGTHDKKTLWRIKAKAAFPVGATPSFHVSYTCGSETNFVFYIGPKGSFAGGPNTPWYPRFGTYTGTVEDGHFDEENRCLGKLHFDIPSGQEAVATGAKISQKTVGDRTLVDYEVRQPCALSFASGNYKVYKSPGKFPVSFYLLNEIEDPQAYVDLLRRVVDHLASVFGPYPYPEFAVVEVDDLASSGAGFGGASMACFMLSNTSFLKGGFNLAFFGHEIGHQWWGNLVVNGGSNGGYMLDEAMAQYGSLRAVESLGSSARALQYRTIGYPDYIDSQCAEYYFLLAAAGYDHRLVDLPTASLSHQLADSKGFYVYHMLRHVIGEATFDKCLQGITKKRSFGEISWNEFRIEAEKASGQNLGWFWDQWMNRTGAPVVDMKWTTNGSELKVSVTQSGELYRLLMPLVINYSDGSTEVRDLDIKSQQTDVTFPVKKAILSVKLDPTMETLHLTSESKAKYEALAPFAKAWWLVAYEGKVEDARKTLEDYLKTVTSPDPYGAEFAARALLAGLISRAKKPEEALVQMEKALACGSRYELRLPQAYLTYANILVELGQKEKAKSAAETVILLEAKLGKVTATSEAARKLIKGLDSGT